LLAADERSIGHVNQEGVSLGLDCFVLGGDEELVHRLIDMEHPFKNKLFFLVVRCISDVISGEGSY
jgi:hypothetical protein